MSGAQRKVGVPMRRRKIMNPEFLQLLDEIDPTVKASNSRNLKCWMAKYGRPGDSVFSLNASSRLVSTFPEGTLFIGQPYNVHPADNEFSGALFMGVLCLGGRAVRSCYANQVSELREVKGFWMDYKTRGRCAIDPMHTLDFIDADRFESIAGRRQCLWCSHDLELCTSAT